MGYQFECTVDGCDYVAEGETEEEVVEQITDHVREEHPEVDAEEAMTQESPRQV